MRPSWPPSRTQALASLRQKPQPREHTSEPSRSKYSTYKTLTTYLPTYEPTSQPARLANIALVFYFIFKFLFLTGYFLLNCHLQTNRPVVTRSPPPPPATTTPRIHTPFPPALSLPTRPDKPHPSSSSPEPKKTHTLSRPLFPTTTHF